MKDTYILAIESSCDETSAAIVKNGNEQYANIIASQINSHKRFGGVVPEIASRHHVEEIVYVIDEALNVANMTMEKIDAVAVTSGPGLVGSLLVGMSAAKALAYAHNKPLIAVNHMAGHIYANQLVTPLQFPLLALLVSGGHTELVYMTDHNHYEIIGQTRDDAVGEAYDKVGRLMELPYPSGKWIDEMAHKGQDVFNFPRAMIKEDNFDFSFSGLKSAIINMVHQAKQKEQYIDANDLAASFQASVIDVLVEKTYRALQNYPNVKQLIVSGGVAANKGLRKGLTHMVEENFSNVTIQFPPLVLCGDNAAMIAAAAYPLYQAKQFVSLTINANPSQMLSE